MDPLDVAALSLRVVIGTTMIAHGLNHWVLGGRIEGTARWFAGLGLRRPTFQAWASVVTELGAGALLLVGAATPLACAAVIAVMGVAGTLAHRRNGFFVFKDGYEYVLVLAVASVALSLIGPGEASVDAWLEIDVDRWTSGTIAALAGLGGLAAHLAAFWRPTNDRD